MSFEEGRKYERRPFSKTIRFYLTALRTDKLEKIYGNGVSVDISEGGLGLITDYPLAGGDIIYFDPEIEVNDSKKSVSIVRWVLEIKKNKYLAGTEFLR